MGERPEAERRWTLAVCDDCGFTEVPEDASTGNGHASTCPMHGEDEVEVMPVSEAAARVAELEADLDAEHTRRNEMENEYLVQQNSDEEAGAKLQARVAELEEALRAVEATDKTPAYEYGKGKQSRNRAGALPESGRWQTPREIARAALAAGKGSHDGC